ncbi:MAG: hypothetical protein AAF604_15950 [Acidobacteriota bacterium]
MAEMGKYCKAYLAKDLRAFASWSEKTDQLMREKKVVDGQEVEVERDSLDDEDILYLQENYTVTDGIFIDEHIIFDDITDEWKDFCHDKLQFEIPVYEPIEIKPAEADSASA